tara:strand:- start:95 stop:937 length:843 start_codon:yes stop_codon:yes gene_type:complete
MSENTFDQEPSEIIDSAVENEELLDDVIDSENESTESEDDTDEVEYKGEKYKIPKALKPAIMKDADYTQKTQELAREREIIAKLREESEAEKQSIQEKLKTNIQERGRLAAITDTLQQYEGLNWSEISDQDPVHAQKLWIQYSQLKESAKELAGRIQKEDWQASQETQLREAKRIQEGQAFLAEKVPNWSPKLAGDLVNYASSIGWSQSEIQRITAPQVIALHRAFVGDQLLAKRNLKVSDEVRPVPKVGGNAAVKKDVSRMSDAEFASMRRQQIKNRNK